MSVETTKEVLARYLNSGHSDQSMLAEDVSFTIMATGKEHRGREGVSAMLNYFYRIAFEADAKTRTLVFGETSAIWEGVIVGKHIGEYASVPATGKNVRVPICVVYDVEDKRVKRARVYFEVPAFYQQVGVKMG
ncbi:MAG TPA: ester cyclase [Anaerolineales bacterium]|nr:ester cyclase [Anaerolineales bacterium]